MSDLFPMLDDDDDDVDPWGETRPLFRGHCENAARPCPWVSCRYHLYLEVRADNLVRFNFPDREPEELLESCALDIATGGSHTLEAVARLLGVSRERIRQIEDAALDKLRETRFSSTNKFDVD